MNASDVMKDLSRKHKRFPKAALTAAVTMRSDVAPLMLKELKRLLATFDANLDAPTEKEYKAKMKQVVKVPSPLFYGFFLAAEWKQKEAFRPFAEFLRWREAMLPNLLSEAVVSEDVNRRRELTRPSLSFQCFITPIGVETPRRMTSGRVEDASTRPRCHFGAWLPPEPPRSGPQRAAISRLGIGRA
jgi:hypothetical protein